MFIFWVAKRQETPGPSVSINCPRCGAQGVVGQSYELLETLRLFDAIPLLKMRNTVVRCGGCKAKLASKLSVGDLEKYKGTGVSQFLSDGVSFVFKFLAVVSLLLFFAPVLGLVLTGITVLGTFRSHNWARTVGIISLALSSIVTVLFFIGLIVFK